MWFWDQGQNNVSMDDFLSLCIGKKGVVQLPDHIVGLGPADLLCPGGQVPPWDEIADWYQDLIALIYIALMIMINKMFSFSQGCYVQDKCTILCAIF